LGDDEIYFCRTQIGVLGNAVTVLHAVYQIVTLIARRAVLDAPSNRTAIVLEQILHALPGLQRHQGRLLAGIDLVSVADLTGIGDVGQIPKIGV
jgi:hypothetical protein